MVITNGARVTGAGALVTGMTAGTGMTVGTGAGVETVASTGVTGVTGDEAGTLLLHSRVISRASKILHPLCRARIFC